MASQDQTSVPGQRVLRPRRWLPGTPVAGVAGGAAPRGGRRAHGAPVCMLICVGAEEEGV